MQARANLTLDAVHERLQGLDHKAVLAIDRSNGADAIAARRDIPSVRDFRGKRVGYEPGTLEEFFVAWALRENGLTLSDVAPVYGNPEETAKMLQDGRIDVAVTHEPFLSKFASSANFHIVYSSADAPGLITDVLTFRTDFINAHPETVHAVIVAYFEALSFWKLHPQEAYEILANRFEDTPERLAEQFKGITMLDERDNYTAFTFALGLDSLYGNMRQIAKFVKKHREQAAPDFDSDDMIDRRFIKEIHDAT
jgi:NitT/TauT family transport system substrate-binding protein